MFIVSFMQEKLPEKMRLEDGFHQKKRLALHQDINSEGVMLFLRELIQWVLEMKYN
jgi:hypothetical protein